MPATLVKGPIQILPLLKYPPLRRNGPFASPSTPNRKAVVTLVFDDFTTATCAMHLSALTTTDGGTTWTEVPGPAVYCKPNGFSYSMQALPCRQGEDVFILHTLTAGNYALLKFNLLTFTWTTLNAAIASYAAATNDPGLTVTPGIIVNSLGYGLANISNDPDQQQSILRFRTDGTALSIDRFLEPDAGWNNGNPGFRVISQLSPPNYFAGVALDNTFTASVLEGDGSGNFRERTVHWSSDTATRTLSIAVPTFPISTSASSSVLAQLIPGTGGALAAQFLDIANPTAQPAVFSPTNSPDIPGIPTATRFAGNSWGAGMQENQCLFVVWTEYQQFGTAKKLFIIERDDTNTWGAPQQLYVDNGNETLSPVLTGSAFEIVGSTVDIITDNLDYDHPVPFDHYKWDPLWYWQVSVPTCGVTLACPAGGGSAEVGVLYDKTLVVVGGTGPFTFAIISGALPAGLTLNTATGEITGTPTAAGNSTYTAQVTDSLGAVGTTIGGCTISVTAPSHGISRGMSILTAKQFSELREKGLVGMPTDIYLDQAYPNAGFHVWPIPSLAWIIEFYYWAVLQQFAAVTDTLSIPPAYYDALVFALAVALSPSYRRPVPPSILALAAAAKKDVQDINSQILSGSYHISRTLEGPNEGEPKPAALGPPQPRLLPGAKGE